ncbi:hypothetical protein [Actinoallomurus sp. NPDC050550]|uniref:hypothetical protein n=1 Tax=Actinoallomurus sp. NPDC050550 TaxID=3154937 RepID=UPI0033DE2420
MTVPARTGFARRLSDVGYGYRIEDSPGVTIHTEDECRELAGGDPDLHQSLPHRLAYSQALAAGLTQAGIKGIKVDSRID